VPFPISARNPAASEIRMTLLEIFFVSLAMSLDCFAVALSCGMRLPSNRYRKFLKIALAFGIFQAAMPLAGSLLSRYLLARYISRWSFLISSLVFGVLGGKTFYDYWTGQEEKKDGPGCMCDSARCLMSLAVATSIDAFLIGSVLGLKAVSLPRVVAWIGGVTFLNSMIGCFLGNKAVGFLTRYARLLAGVILLGLAVKAWF
jgi:putative Mn2+ efflux pump MntP